MKKLLISAAVTALFCMTAAAQAETVTPTDLHGWQAENVRANATVGIDGTYAPAGESGALTFTTNMIVNGQDKADFVHALSGTLGDLVSNGGLSYDYFVSSASTTAAHLAPAFRLGFYDAATSKSGYLIWEPVYNGVSDVANDAWVHNDILGGNFWMRTFSPGNTIEQYNVTLADWASGVTFPGSYQLSDATQILSVEVGVGSGWGNAFSGAVDHVNVSFGQNGTGVDANFEVAGVPEPATWAMLLLGFGCVGMLARRRNPQAAIA